MSDDLTTHWRKQYENKYLGSWDFWDKSTGRYLEADLKIESVTLEEVIGEGGRTSDLWIMRLSGRKGPIKTPMIVTRTSGTALQRMFGPRPADWVGKTIHLFVNKKKVAKGSGDVLTIRSNAGNQDLRRQLEQRAPAIAPDEFAEDDRHEADLTEPTPPEPREPGSDDT